MPSQSVGSEGSGREIDFSELKIESHALAAFEVARDLVGGGEITAGSLLSAVVLVGRQGGSKAFSYVESLLTALEVQAVPEEKGKQLSGPPVFRLTPELSRSYEVAERFIHNASSIWGRDIVTIAVLADEDSSLEELARQAGSTKADLQDGWFEFVSTDSSHRSPEEWENWWRTAEVPLPSERESRAPDALPYAATLSDMDHRNDWIGVRSDVQALSTLISVNQVQPPLSVAILGDWGSGKTFLMRKVMERVQVLEQVGKEQEQLAGAPEAESADTEDEKEARYCSSILQIEFNAWHYAESNLWASLVNRIFEKLHARLNPDTDDREQADIVERFFETLETARAAQEVARQEVELIKAEIGVAEKAVGDANTEVDEARTKLVAASGLNVWEYLDDQLRALVAEGRAADLEKALTHFGYEGALDSAETIYDVACRFRSVGGRAHQVVGSLLATKRGVIGAVLLSVAVAVATGLATWLETPVLSLGTAFAGALAWLAERAASATKWLDKIESFDQSFSRMKLEQEAKKEELIAEARTELEKSSEALDFAKQRLGEAEARVARARADLQKLTARDQMRRFVDERVTEQTYSQHLGLISMIRRDFEGLSDLMYRDTQPGESSLVRRVEAEILKELPTVERIILYIDDLDRCEPDRVVEVLEAVHLLLAFRLFVVVVAVDPRWVLESLSIRYPHLARKLTAQDICEDGAGGNAATTHDYLEKIFNIPFWVRPMGPKACRRLVSGYLGFEDSEGEDGDPDRQSDNERFNDLFAERVARDSLITERPFFAEDPSEEGESEGSQTQNKGRASAATMARLEKERAIATKEIASVEVSGAEELFIKKLAPYLGSSPRRIKRYANVYRLMKSGLTKREVAVFSDPEATDDHRIVLVFLAIVTGAPTLAPGIFAKAFELRKEFKVDSLLARCEIDAGDSHNAEIVNARGALKLLDGVDVTKERIETWVPRVMRYAFRLTPVNVQTVQPLEKSV